VQLIDPNVLFVARQKREQSDPSALTRTSNAQDRRPAHKAIGHDPELVETLLHRGLGAPRQLNRATAALGFWLRWHQYLTLDQAINWMQRWLDQHHNNQSRTYNRNPERAHRQVKAALERIYARTPSRVWCPKPGLSKIETQALLELTASDQACCDPATGEVLDRYKLQQFAFELMRCAKQYVLTTVQRAINEGRNDDDAIVRELSVVWPDPRSEEFVVPLPVSLRQGRGRAEKSFLAGIGRDRRWAYWRALQFLGLFRRVRSSSRIAHRAARYAVILDFKAAPGDEETFHSLDTAILRLIPSDKRRTQYSKHRCQRLKKRASPNPEPDPIANRASQEFLARFTQTTSSSVTGTPHDDPPAE